MSIENRATETAASSSAETSLTFRSSDDRWCPHCSAIALVYDTDAGQSRCRACGELE